jgi:aminopeptidase C
MRKSQSTFKKRFRKQTTAAGTSVSSLSSVFSISAAESQSIFSLLAATLGSTPVSVAFAYRDLRAFVFFTSTYTINTIGGNKIFLGNR